MKHREPKKPPPEPSKSGVEKPADKSTSKPSQNPSHDPSASSSGAASSSHAPPHDHVPILQIPEDTAEKDNFQSVDDGATDPTEVATNPDDDVPDTIEYQFATEINQAISNFYTSRVSAPETKVFNVSQSTFANVPDVSKMRPDLEWSFPGHKPSSSSMGSLRVKFTALTRRPVTLHPKRCLPMGN